MSGDVRAVMALLRIHDARMRLLGLYPKQARRDPRASWDNCQGPPTVVVRADDCRHEGCERHGKFAIARTHRRVSDGPAPRLLGAWLREGPQRCTRTRWGQEPLPSCSCRGSQGLRLEGVPAVGHRRR